MFKTTIFDFKNFSKTNGKQHQVIKRNPAYRRHLIS